MGVNGLVLGCMGGGLHYWDVSPANEAALWMVRRAPCFATPYDGLARNGTRRADAAATAPCC